MIKVAICDDEKNIRSYLASLIRGQKAECEITEYASADEYLSSGMGHDLLFLDIELEGSASGMDGNAINGMGMARQIRGMEQIKQPVIIFVTGYEKYVYDAFEVEALGYLVKPVNEQKFAEVFSRAQDKILSETEQKKKNPAYPVRRGKQSHTVRPYLLHGKPETQGSALYQRRGSGILCKNRGA